MTDEPLKYDPRTKQQIKEALYEYLYAPIIKEFDRRIEVLVIKNTALIKGTHRSFYYKGEIYNAEPTPPPRRISSLHSSLKNEMDIYIRDTEELNNKEIPYVLSFINKVLNASDSLKDYLLVFPESIHAPLLNLSVTCPCKNINLTEDKVLTIQEQFDKSIDLIKQRMVLNLLI